VKIDLRHELILVRKYEKPETIRGIWTNPAWRKDNSRALWEVIQSSPEADAMLQTTLEPDWLLITPPNSGVFFDYDLREIERFDGVVAVEAVERYLVHAGLVLQINPWTLGGEMPKTLGKRLLVAPDDPTKRNDGAKIITPDTAQRRPVTGVIVDVGSDVTDPDLTVGARILYSLYAGTDLEVNGVRRIIMNADQAMAVVGADERVEAA